MGTVVVVIGWMITVSIALLQYYQANQLHLFDQRLIVIEVIQCIYQSIVNQKHLLEVESKNTKIQYSDILFVFLMNNYLMEECQKNIGKSTFTKFFLLKQAEIRQIINKAYFLFRREDAVLCESFIETYFTCLTRYNQMQCLLRTINGTFVDEPISMDLIAIQEKNRQQLQEQSNKIRESCMALLRSLQQVENKKLLRNLSKRTKILFHNFR